MIELAYFAFQGAYVFLYLKFDSELSQEHQWGFRPSRSTLDAGSSLIETILTALNNRQPVGVVDIDLQKAFDSLDHCCLLQKLLSYGLDGAALD